MKKVKKIWSAGYENNTKIENILVTIERVKTY